MVFITYKPPKTLRLLFIIHYAPLLLIIMIGPQTALFNIWHLPFPQGPTIILGALVFLAGTILYFKWEFFWHRSFHGQLVTTGICSIIRHPHYTSILIIGYGLAFFFYSIAALVLATIAIPIMIISILDEEQLLLNQYGIKYKKYMKQTPYRLIPKIY
ncbi:MAG: methyltransferase [Candidatus Thermoplasmatota archaeon]|nr:methyltransferase [Candidatus Thermoplasmatota archaeon]